MPFCDESESYAVIPHNLGTCVRSNLADKSVKEELTKWRALEPFGSRFEVGKILCEFGSKFWPMPLYEFQCPVAD